MDYVIVLANLMDSNAILNDESLSRLSTAVDLCVDCPRANLVLCGWPYRDDVSVSIAQAMYTCLLSRFEYIPSHITLQPFSRDTVGDAVLTRILLQYCLPHQCDSVKVVTSSYHVNRVQLIFNFVFNGYSSTKVISSDDNHISPHQLKSEIASTSSFRTTFSGIHSGNIFQIYNRLSSAHPFYNGLVHPQIPVLSQMIQNLYFSISP